MIRYKDVFFFCRRDNAAGAVYGAVCSSHLVDGLLGGIDSLEVAVRHRLDLFRRVEQLLGRVCGRSEGMREEGREGESTKQRIIRKRSTPPTMPVVGKKTCRNSHTQHPATTSTSTTPSLIRSPTWLRVGCIFFPASASCFADAWMAGFFFASASAAGETTPVAPSTLSRIAAASRDMAQVGSMPSPGVSPGFCAAIRIRAVGKCSCGRVRASEGRQREER